MPAVLDSKSMSVKHVTELGGKCCYSLHSYAHISAFHNFLVCFSPTYPSLLSPYSVPCLDRTVLKYSNSLILHPLLPQPYLTLHSLCPNSLIHCNLANIHLHPSVTSPIRFIHISLKHLLSEQEKLLVAAWF